MPKDFIIDEAPTPKAVLLPKLAPIVKPPTQERVAFHREKNRVLSSLRDLPPLIDLSLYEKLAPTDIIQHQDEVWNPCEDTWRIATQIGLRAGNNLTYRRWKFRHHVSIDPIKEYAHLVDTSKYIILEKNAIKEIGDEFYYPEDNEWIKVSLVGEKSNTHIYRRKKESKHG